MSKVISIRLDDDVQKNAKQLAADMGLSLSAVVNSYLKQIVASRSLTIFAAEPIDARLDAKLAEISEQKTSQPFDDVDQLISNLED